MKYFFYVITLFIFSSCIKTLELDAKETSEKLVVNSIFHDQDTWKINVTSSLSVLSRDELVVNKNATIKIFDKNKILIESFSFDYYSNVNYYYSSIKSIEGQNYNIEVSAPNLETVYSEGFIPYKTPIISLDTSTILSISGDIKRMVTITFQDKPNEKNYYSVALSSTKYSIDTNLTGGLDTNYKYRTDGLLTSQSYLVDNSINNMYLLFFKDDLFDGKKQSFSFTYNLKKDTTPSKNDLFNTTVILLTLSEDVYKYRKSYNKYVRSKKNPFAEPVQVYSNINNGIGIFGGESFDYRRFYSNTK